MLVLLFLSFLPQQSAMDEAIALMQRGRSNPARAQGKADLQKAADAFGQILSIDPKFSPALYMRGCCYFYMRKDNKARADFDAVIALDQKMSGAYFYRGLSYMYTASLEKAEKDFLKAIELEPRNAGYYSELARLKSMMGLGNQAMAYFEEAIAVDPNHVKSLDLSANLLNQTGQFDKALTRWEKVVSLAPQYGKARFNVGIIYQAKGQLEKALSIFQDLHQKNPNDWQVVTRLIQTYQVLGRLEARNREIEKLFAMRASNKKSKLAKEARYCRHQWAFEDMWIYAFEYFELAGNESKKYSFMVTEKDKKTLRFEISLGSYAEANQVARQAGEIGQGERIFHLDRYEQDGAHTPLRKLEADPGYDKMQEMVTQLLKGETTSAGK